MKRFGEIAVCFASGLVLSTGLYVSNGALPSNPYEPIITRNIFDLNPPQAVNSTAPEPPSKITLDGIMTIFGTPQALFKVAVPPRPPAPATEKSYILSEGQRQDDIEVTRIDEKADIVTFNNHGVEQQIPLLKAPPITTPTPVVMNAGFAAPAAAPGSYNSYGGGGNVVRFGNRFGQNRSLGNAGGNFGNNSANNPGGNLGSAGFGSAGSSSVGGPTGQQLTPEEQMIMIAAEKAKAQQEGNPIWRIYPPTPLDEAAGTVNSSPSGAAPSQ